MTATATVHAADPADSRSELRLNALRWARPALSLVALAVLSACASMGPAASGKGDQTVAAAAPAAPASAASGAAADKKDKDSKAKPFAKVVEGAESTAGVLTVWRKDDDVWLEVPEELLGQPLLFSANISQSVGERGLYASQMGPSWLVRFRRIGETMQIVADNTAFRGGDDAATKKAVSEGFSPSLIASTKIVSAPHPDRKSVLIDASFLLADIPGYSTKLEAAFRMPYGLDRGNSFIETGHADARLTTVGTRLHFSTPRIPAPPIKPSGGPGPKPPETTPDPRSFFVGVVYSFSALPETPMRPRLADPRIGHFSDAYTDLGSDLKANPRVHYINRWRLEKKDPTAELSEPKQPIVYWLDSNIPERYRASIKAGILEWNKAFERIGFKDAIVVKQQDDDATFDDMDSAHASIRWFVGSDVGFAIGPSHSDPRTGEILDADIGMSDVFARGARRQIVEDIGRSHAHDANGVGFGGHAGHDAEHCAYAAEAATEMEFALDLMEARGDIAPDSPEADAFVQATIKDTIMHEVGHTLGLKHNFKASTVVTRAQLRDPAFTEAHGISGSVMDYNANNLALAGEREAAFNNTTIGPYDYWAIQYAYSEVDASQEGAALSRIAARSTEPLLAYADDADARSLGEGGEGLDPYANLFDLGDDPLAYYVKRMTLSKELWARVQERGPRAGDDPLRLRRSLIAGFRQLRRLPALAAKYVGGMETVRDLPGTTDRPNYRPVDMKQQRAALKFLTDDIFSDDSFSFRPEFLASLSPDYNEWDRGGPVSIPEAVLQLQTGALDRLMSASTARRLLDQPLYLPAAQRRGALSLDEMYTTLQGAVWSELRSGREIERMRRDLQREHLDRVRKLLVSPPDDLPADALSLARWNAEKLKAELARAQARPGLSVVTRAHLRDSLNTLSEALKATMQRRT